MSYSKRHWAVFFTAIISISIPAAALIHGCGGGSSVDGGIDPDGGVHYDGGIQPDGGMTPDGGTVTDGGTNPDGGMNPDGGVKPDAGETDGGINTDAGPNPDGSIADGGGNPDGSVTDGGAGCTYSGFTVVKSETRYGKDKDQNKDYWTYIGANASDFPADWVDIENWVSYGGPSTAGIYNISENETSYATCGFCFIIMQNCDSGGTCEKTYMPKAGGTFTLATLDKAPGGTFSGSLSGVKFQEVEIDPETYETNPVPGGGTWCMNGFAWSGTIPIPPDGGTADGGTTDGGAVMDGGI